MAKPSDVWVLNAIPIYTPFGHLIIFCSIVIVDHLTYTISVLEHVESMMSLLTITWSMPLVLVVFSPMVPSAEYM